MTIGSHVIAVHVDDESLRGRVGRVVVKTPDEEESTLPEDVVVRLETGERVCFESRELLEILG